MLSRHLHNNAGISLLESLVALGLVGIVALGSMTLIRDVQKIQAGGSQKVALEAISHSLQATITNQDAWDMTKQKNPTMACARTFPSSCAANTSHLISLYSSEGKQITDAALTTFGMHSDGTTCTTFGSTPNVCAFRAEIRWTIRCDTPQECQYPDEQISITFKYSGTNSVNVARYNTAPVLRNNFAANSSPMASCASKGRFFVGYGQAVENGDGQTFGADSEGCIGPIAFRGRQGPQGPQGATGPAGPQGPRGPAGGSSDAPLPSVPLDPSVTCPGGSGSIQSPKGTNSCTYSYGMASAGEAMQGTIRSSKPNVQGTELYGICKSDGTWDFRIRCHDEGARTCIAGSQTIKSVTGTNTCVFSWPQGTEGESINIVGTNGGVGTATCHTQSSNWDLSYTCPDNTAACPGGEGNTFSPTGRNCMFEWGSAPVGTIATGSPYHEHDVYTSGTLQAECLPNLTWRVISMPSCHDARP